MKANLLLFTLFVCCIAFHNKALAQETTNSEKLSPPAFKTTRAEEDYSYLKSPEESPYKPAFGDALKYIALNDERTNYLTFGAGYRARWESFVNQDWTDTNDAYYSQRINLYANLHLGEHIRFFGELYHGLTSEKKRVLEDEEVDLHQGFLEINFLPNKKSTLDLRLGRQEMGFGASRLFGIREGPNMRRTFDLVRVIRYNGKRTMHLFYGREVDPQFFAFDNQSNIFGEAEIANPQIWGAYLQGPSFVENAQLDFYYIGFQSKLATFNDVTGREDRHTVGVRSSGNPDDNFSYNTELIYQFGSIGDNSISAFNIEADYKIRVSKASWKPMLGLKFDWSSGDSESGDGKIQTFNPLFVNPAIYSLAGVNTPANLTSLHPNFTFYPAPKLYCYVEYAFFYRTQENDGFYSPPRFQTRPAEGISSRHIGDAFGLQVIWNVNRNIQYQLMSTYFLAADFIEASGPSNNIFYLSTTFTFRI